MSVISDLNQHLPRQRGFTLIELMVGMVIGLIVLSTAIAIYLMGVRGSTHAVRAAKLNQEMRTGMTLMVDDIRRAGYWGNFQQDVTSPFTNRVAPVDVTDPPVTDIHILPFNDVANACILYSYDATYQNNNHRGTPIGDRVSDPNPKGVDFYGFRLTADGVLQMRHGGNSTNNCADTNDNWQPITDPNTVVIQTLSFDTVGSQCLNVTIVNDWAVNDSADDPTVPACEDTTSYAAPIKSYVAPNPDERLIEIRQINVLMEARHVNDAEMRARLQQSVKVRNDRLFTF